jgi:membrane protease YdiL (CAAX protease family)
MNDLPPGLPVDPSQPPPIVTPPSPAPNTVFRGPNGIRAGWRATIFLAIVAALFLVLILVVALVSRGRGQFGVSQLTPVGTGLGEAAIFLFTSLAALIMARIERRTYGEYGLPLRGAFGRHFWTGTLVGFLAISGCLLGIFAFHGFRLTGLAIHGETILSATAAWTVSFIFVGLAEEFAFRGYLQYTLTTGMGFWPSAILLSSLFGLAHAGNPGESKTGLLSVVLFGLLFCLFLLRTGNLWWAVGFHAGWDWGQTFFYGVPDSGVLPYHNLFNCSFSGNAWLTGGNVGPEASVFTPVVLGIVAILFAWVYRENRYQVTPQASTLRFRAPDSQPQPPVGA